MILESTVASWGKGVNTETLRSKHPGKVGVLEAGRLSNWSLGTRGSSLLAAKGQMSSSVGTFQMKIVSCWVEVFLRLAISRNKLRGWWGALFVVQLLSWPLWGKRGCHQVSFSAEIQIRWPLAREQKTWIPGSAGHWWNGSSPWTYLSSVHWRGSITLECQNCLSLGQIQPAIVFSFAYKLWLWFVI